jgi:hypothetical protein
MGRKGGGKSSSLYTQVVYLPSAQHVTNRHSNIFCLNHIIFNKSLRRSLKVLPKDLFESSKCTLQDDQLSI